MAAIHAVLFELVNERLTAIFANHSSHGTAAFWPRQSSGEVNMDFWCRYPFFGGGRLDVNEGNLFNKDYHPVF